MSKKKSIVMLSILALIIFIVSFLLFVPFNLPGTYNGQPKKWVGIVNLIDQGIDLKGGYYVVLEAEVKNDSEAAANVDDAVTILRTRLDSKGYTEATITTQDIGTANPKIRIEIPEVKNADEILKYIGSTGELSFQDESGKVYLTGDDVDSCKAAYDSQNSGYVVALQFTTEGATKFYEATSALVNKTLYIYLGDDVISQPTVSAAISGGSAQIDGFADYDAADAVASVIESGKLPLKFSITEAQLISASLGTEALKMALIAGIIGIICIFIIMIVMYRGLGICASIALIIYTLALLLLLAFLPWVQLTLPGIAGIILSIGMAVDANVIIFERIKEDYGRREMVMNNAIKSGFKKAVVTVIDANVTTLLAAIVLWIMTPGSVKGFAITLFVGVLLSMITAIFVTRWLIKVITPLANNKEKFLNLKREGTTNE